MHQTPEASRVAIKEVNIAEGCPLKGLPELVQFREEARV